MIRTFRALLLDEPAGTDRASRRAQTLLRALLLGLVYLLVSYLSSQLRYSFSAMPLSLHAGVALAALLCWGYRMAPAVFVSHFLLVWIVSSGNSRPLVAGGLGFATGVMLEILAAAWLTRRFLAQPLLLNGYADALRFLLLIVPLSASLSGLGSVTTLVLAYGFPHSDQLPGIWLDVWVSHCLGMLVATPITLCLIGQVREVWAPRQLSVALPLGLAATLLASGMAAVVRWDGERHGASFDQEVLVTANAVQSALHEPLAVLAAARGLLSAHPEVTLTEFRTATRSFFPANGLAAAVGHATLIDQAMVVQHAEPRSHGVMAPGVDLRTAPATRAALEQAQLSGQAVAAEAYAGEGEEPEQHVAVLQALYEGRPASATERVKSVRAAVFVTLKPEALLRTVLNRGSGRLLVCLIDSDASSGLRRLAGPRDCEHMALQSREQQHAVGFAGRHWLLRVHTADARPRHATAGTQVFAVSSFLGMGLLGTVLLTMSGRARRVEGLVHQRSAELQQASRALRRNEQRFRSVFDAAPVGVFIADLSGVPLDANPQLCRMLDCSVGELLELYLPYAAEDAALARQLVAGPESSRVSRRAYVRRDGQIVQALLMMSLLRDELGRPEHVVGVVQDLRDQLKLAEHEQARHAAELSNRAKSEFLSHMSHELRTPLNGLLGFTQLLQMGPEPLSPQQRDWIDKIGRAGWHLLAMINDVLDLSRIESGQLKVVLEPQDMHRLGEEVVALLSRAAQRRKITVKTRLSEQARFAVGDATRIREVLTNLLSNAIKYNAEGGQVVLSARLVGAHWLELSVADTGPGLSAAQQEALFQPFNRLGQERGKVEGSGIGLVISSRLAELMHGELLVHSEVDRGSVFTLRLPVASAPALGSAEPALPSAQFSGRRRVVYIEDNLVNAEVMRAVLAQRPQIELSCYEDGASGLAAVLVEPPDLLMLDMQLPDTDGLTLLRQLRAQPQCAGTAVLIVSADALGESFKHSGDAGNVHTITKPFETHELLALVDHLLAVLPESRGRGAAR